MRIAVLGTGHMGRTLGEAFVRAGHDVFYGSRDPDQAVELPAPVTSHREAIVDSELVLSAIAAPHTLQTLTPLRDELAGRVLIDIGNAVDDTLDLKYPDSSLGERLQQTLPETRIVKTLSTLAGTVGVDPSQLTSPTNVFLSGDDPSAKDVVAGLLADLGWDEDRQIDLGTIETARAVEHYFLFFIAVAGALETPEFNISVTR